MSSRQFVKFDLVLICRIVLLLGLTSSAYCGDNLDETKHVLMLHSYHQRMTWVKDITRAVEDVLRPEENNLSLHVENMDSKVFHSPEYFESFRNYLKVKYRGTQFSLILSSDNHAYDFLRNHRDKLFPGVPVSFCGVNGFQQDQINGLDGFTGVAEIFSARETLEAALSMHPSTKDVYVINDYLKTGRAWARDIDNDVQGLTEQVRLIHADNLSIQELMDQISKLGPDTIVLLGVYFADKDGRYFTYERIGAMLAESSNVPVYCLLEFNIGKGVVGGKVISGYYQGKAMAQTGLKILAGSDPGNIPVIKAGVNKGVFDYSQLERFGINESALPTDSDVINRPYSFYDEHKTEVWIVVTFIAALIVAILSLAINIARRTRAENSLRVSEERFRQLANATWEAIVIHEGGVLLHANDLFFNMYGYEPRELMGEQIFPLIIAPNSVDYVRRRMEKGDLGPYEAVGLRKDGINFPMEVRVRTMEHEGRDVRVAAIRDLTERKRMEERLSQSQKMEAIGTLAGGIAHDFNNILAAMIGYSELTAMELPKGSEAKRNIAEVLSAGNRAKELVKQILTFARKAKEERRPIQVSIVVKEALKLLRASLPTSIEIRQKIESNSMVLSDTTQIHQIMMNLCTNAGKAMPRGGVLEVSIQDIDLDEEFSVKHVEIIPGRYLRLRVRDTGVGMPPEVKGRIFDPFFTTRMKGEGTGMGLSVVHGIVKDCRGLITVSSEPEHGSTFNVFLPVTLEKQVKQAHEKETLTGGSETIMYVDDEVSLVSMVKSMLTKLGYNVIDFTNSIEALEAFRDSPEQFDLIITDMTMPKMSGRELSSHLLSIRSDIPIIICTGYSEHISDESSKMLGIRSYVQKPFVMKELTKTIRDVLSTSSSK